VQKEWRVHDERRCEMMHICCSNTFWQHCNRLRVCTLGNLIRFDWEHVVLVYTIGNRGSKYYLSRIDKI